MGRWRHFSNRSMHCFAPAAHSSNIALFSRQTKTTRKSRVRESFCSRSIRNENAVVKPRRDDDDDDDDEVFGGEREVRTTNTNTNTNTTHRSKRGRRKRRDILLVCGSLLLFSNSSSQKEEAFAAGMMDFTKQSQSTFQLGPLQVTLQRLRTLRNDIITSLEEEGKEKKKNENGDKDVVVVKPGSEEAIEITKRDVGLHLRETGVGGVRQRQRRVHAIHRLEERLEEIRDRGGERESEREER